MSLSTQGIRRLIETRAESKNLDYKEMFNWNTATNDDKVQLVKDILAMSNTHGGGNIIFGIRDDDFTAVGISRESYISFDTTKVNDFLQKYSDPSITCNVIKAEEINGKYFVIIEVPEFQEIPTICKKDANSSVNQKLLLRKGQIYIRTARGSSEIISSAEEMRELLNRATIKKNDDLLEKLQPYLQLALTNAIAAQEKQGKINQEPIYINNRKDLLRKTLSKAMERNQLELYYQPILDLKQKKLNKVEALIRWKHPQLGLISPLEFIPIAVEQSLIHILGKWTINQICSQIKEWKNLSFDVSKVALNLSFYELTHNNLVHTLKEGVVNNNINANNIVIEINEHAVNNVEKSNNIIKDLRESGFDVTLDNFGTGYSSLHYLKNLAIKSIKIDTSIINEFSSEKNGEANEALISAIIQLSKMMNLGCLAEAVETKEQLDFLINAGCHEVQGYLISKPMKSDELVYNYGLLETHINNLLNFPVITI